MKKQKEILVYDLSELIACYMYQTKQEELTVLEVNNLYKCLVDYSDNVYEIYVNYTPNNTIETLPTFIPLFEVEENVIKLLNHIEILDVYVVLVKGLEPNKKRVLTKIVDDYLKINEFKSDGLASC